MFFWKKEKRLQQDVEEYLRETERCLEAFVEAFAVYFERGVCDAFERLVEKTHRAEGDADRRRREIEATMYGKALIPESRGDVLGMLESLDLVPNKCESVLYHISTEGLVVPEAFRETFRRLVQVNMESHGLLCRIVRDLFADARQVGPGAARVTEKETESDEIERGLIRDIFRSELDKADMILLKELVLNIGGISDRAENASDRLRIAAAKRLS